VVCGKIKFYNTFIPYARISADRQLRWVLELADYKSLKYPALEKVALRENRSCLQRSDLEHLVKAFEAASIRLVIEDRPSEQSA
jgi:hypothetical protein